MTSDKDKPKDKPRVKIRSVDEFLGERAHRTSQTPGGSLQQFLILALAGVLIVLGSVWTLKDSMREDPRINIVETKAANPEPTPDPSLTLGDIRPVSGTVLVDKKLSDAELRGVVGDATRSAFDRKSAFRFLADRKVIDLPSVAFLGISKGDTLLKCYFIRAIVEFSLAGGFGLKYETNQVELSKQISASKSVVAVIAPWLSDNSGVVRVEAARSLGVLGSPLALTALAAQAESETSESAKQAISEAIEAINGYYLNRGTDGEQGGVGSK